MTERTTIIDVARKAGVSQMTVSRVINNKEDVSPTTRQKVIEVIQQLGYRPSNIARGLVTNRTKTLGVVVPDIDNPFFSGVVQGAENQAYTQGYSVFLCNTDEEQEREIAILESLEEKQIDGLLLCSSRLDDQELGQMLKRFPSVVLISRQFSLANVGMLLIDDQMAGAMATNHLIDRGHRAIGLVSGPPISFSGKNRFKGYQVALANHGLKFHPEWVRHCSPVVEDGYQISLGLLKEQPKLTALICHNDLVAVGALQACLELGYRVPEDLAVIGHDDILIASLVTPALTTVHVPRYDLGAKAMSFLLNQIMQITDKAGCAESPMIIKPKLIIREST